jgi:hypothetical protein
MTNNRTGRLDRPPGSHLGLSEYRSQYILESGFSVKGYRPLRAFAACQGSNKHAIGYFDIAKVQEWLRQR